MACFGNHRWHLENNNKNIKIDELNIKSNRCNMVIIACSRCSDSGTRAKNKASKRAGKNERRLRKSTRGTSSPITPHFFLLFCLLYFSLALHYLNTWNRLDYY